MSRQGDPRGDDLGADVSAVTARIDEQIAQGRVQVAFACEVPETRCSPTDTACTSLPARSSRPVVAGPVRGAVEVYRAVGGLPQQAPVGGTLDPAADSRTTVQVAICDPPARRRGDAELSRGARSRARPGVARLVEALRQGADAADDAVGDALRAVARRLD